MRIALAALTLAGCATMPAGGELPGRGDVERALVIANLCDDSDGQTECHGQPYRARLNRVQCRREDDGRVLCVYAGRLYWTGTRRRRIDGECAWLSRHAGRGWLFDAYPDADLCRFR